MEVCTIGIPAEPLDFLKRAVDAGHPRGVEVHVDDIIQNVVVENFHDDPNLQRSVYISSNDGKNVLESLSRRVILS